MCVRRPIWIVRSAALSSDYDGIVVSAPASYWTHLQSWSLYVYEATHDKPASDIPISKYPLLHKAAIEACDAVDGLKDGLIGDPRKCKFDPGALLCKSQDGADCLTAAQVEAARKVYSPLLNPRTKTEIFPGLLPGSELGWAGLASGDEAPRYVRENVPLHCVQRSPLGLQDTPGGLR